MTAAPFGVTVPTSTVIAVSKENPFKIWMLVPADKHGGKLTLAGGRVDLADGGLKESLWTTLDDYNKKIPELVKGAVPAKLRAVHDNCMLREWGEEMGGGGKPAALKELTLFGVRTDQNAAPKSVSLKKITGENNPFNLPNETKIDARYGCPDFIYTAVVDGTPYPKDGEAKACRCIDLSNIDWATEIKGGQFHPNHILALGLYFLSESGMSFTSQELNQRLSDLGRLRQELPDLIASIQGKEPPSPGLGLA